MIMIVVRKGLDKVFTKKELQVLDDILPAFKRHDRMEDEEALQQVRAPPPPLRLIWSTTTRNDEYFLFS